MANPPLREHYDSDEEYFFELDVYNVQLLTDVENITSLMADTDMDDQGRVVVDGTALGYPLRYLDTAYGSNNLGADFATTPQGLPNGTTPVFQGVRNVSSTAQSTNPSDFTWREVTSAVLSQDLNAFYRVLGGRQIDWMFSSAGDISGYTIDDGIANIDLQTAPEATAADGNSSGDISIYIRANVDSPPTTPADTTDYNTVDGSFTLPTNWVRTQADTTGENPIWESTAAFFGTGILTLDWQEPVRIEGTDVTVTDDGGTVTIDDGENDIDIDRPVVVTIDPPVVTLGANYRGATSGSRTVTVGVTQGSLTYTYDGTTPFANRTFRIDNVVNGSATVSRTDGTFTITATTADTQVVTFDVIIMSNTGTSITVAASFDVLRNTATREAPIVSID